MESWAFRQVLRGLVPADRKGEPRVAGKVDHPQSVTVVSLSGDGRGVAIGPQLAAFASSLGITTHLVTAVGHDRAAPLWAACAADRHGLTSAWPVRRRGTERGDDRLDDHPGRRGPEAT